MNGDRETARIVRSWLQTDEHESADRVLATVLAAIELTPQVGLIRRTKRWMLLAAAAAVLLVAIVGVVEYGQLIGNSIFRPAPPPTAGPDVRSLSDLPAAPMDSGRYVIDDGFGVEVEFAVPDGWSKASQGPGHALIESHSDGAAARPAEGAVLGFFLIDDIFADPCSLDRRTVDPPVGGSVDELVDGFRSIAGYRASVPEPTSIGGFRGQRIDLDLDLYMCPFEQVHLWRTPEGWARTPLGVDEMNTLWILDVDGTRLVLNAATYPETAERRLDELRAVIESIRIEPAAGDPGDD